MGLQCLYFSAVTLHLLDEISVFFEKIADCTNAAEGHFRLQGDHYFDGRPSLPISYLSEIQQVRGPIEVDEVTDPPEAQSIVVEHEVEVLRLPAIIAHVESDVDNTIVETADGLFHREGLCLLPQDIPTHLLAFGEDGFEVAIESVDGVGESVFLGEGLSGAAQQHQSIYYTTVLWINHYLLMQAIPHRSSLLDCFNDYCIRTQSQKGGLSPTFSPLRHSRHSIQWKLKQKPTANGSPLPKSVTQMRQRKLFQEGRQRKAAENRQLLNITPVVVHTSLQSYKQTIRTNSSITIKRKLLRAKTEGGQTDRSSSPFFTQQKGRHGCETPIQSSSLDEINKNRPFTAFPSGQNSVNRLRTIQIDLPKRKLGRAMSFFEEGVTAWETSQQ